ncbi:excalibur calcium-binding domain-containing protein [Sphingobium xenophagum]|uniref:excalibur calcium-binding domain-containing protein n=1 Tax=Sphingobium xenophagum TaxID=121428 RepID=UPI00286BEE77|nr:excalibur calcium-binding domain-containing protein [Sphingobium xenophagum]
MSFRKPFRAVPVRGRTHYATQRRKRWRERSAFQFLIVAVLAAAVGFGSQLLLSNRDDRARQPPSDMSVVTDSAPYVPEPLMSAAELDAQQPSAASGRVAVSPRAVAPSDASAWSYRNCREARAAGAAPLHAGQPGYGTHMDGDGDGIACEPYMGPR